MYHYLQKVTFFKNTYGKPFLVRVEFEAEIPKNCLLVADNICQCDSWFTKDNKVQLKYEVVFSGDFDKIKPTVFKKSIVVDLNKPIDSNGFIELTITNNAGLNDSVHEDFAKLKNDILKDPLH